MEDSSFIISALFCSFPAPLVTPYRRLCLVFGCRGMFYERSVR
jgi:hypothetical protein